MDSAIINSGLPDSASHNGDDVSDEKRPHAFLIDHEKIAEIPFTFENRRSSCIVKYSTGKYELICKGAFEETLNLCTHVHIDKDTNPIALDRINRLKLSRRVSALNAEGYRTILVATREVTAFQCTNLAADTSAETLSALETQLTAHGLLTFLDPPKPDAAASISKLQALGVEVKVLTGDTLGVALQVCRSLNLVPELDEANVQAISGPDLKRLEGTEEFDSVVASCTVFAKLTPEQKGMVIISLKRVGNCVGMLGDGINDSIALKYADVGISVDSGAGVAKDVAESEPQPSYSISPTRLTTHSHPHTEGTPHRC
jgi:Mg2+-importing ATPase